MDGAKKKLKWRDRIGWLLLAGAILTIGFFLVGFLAERSCVSLLAAGEPPIMLPQDCTVKRTAASGQGFEQLEAERLRRGLKRQGWIECGTSANARAWLDSLEADRRWLPSYVAGTYEWRKTVIVVGGGPSSGAGAHVIAEVCVMPWWRYFQLVRGQCEGKFAVWK
jgi:hypothetical protein